MPIVIAEDDLVLRTLMTRLMEKWGFKAVTTKNGHEAMAALRGEQGPTLALLDWMMPGMDGLEVCRRVREGKKMIYVIMLTSLGAKENIVEGLHAGADDYLIKPFDRPERAFGAYPGRIAHSGVTFYAGSAGEGTGEGGWRNR